jgi:signal transduction histidine kinase
MQEDGLMKVAGGLPERVLDRLEALQRFVARPAVMDGIIVLLVLGFAWAQEENAPHVWTSVINLALALPLLGRRRRPALVFAVIAGVALVQWRIGTQAGGDAAVLVALFTLGEYERRRRLIAAGVVIAEIGVVLAVARWAPHDHRIGAGLLLTGTVTAAWVLGVYLRTRRAYLSSVLERAATAEHERDQQALLAVAGERARISREMHDIVAHSLSVMIALSDGAAAAVDRDPEAARTTMGQASSLGRQALGEVRRLLGDAHSPGEPSIADLAPQPGIAQLDDLITQVRAAGLAVELRVNGEQPELAPGMQLAVYRMIQEALTNVLKHAPDATRAVISLRYRSDGIDLDVDNDDKPDPAATGPAGSPAGRGLAGMRERVAVFGGTIESGRRTDGGWRVVAHLPVHQVPAR